MYGSSIETSPWKTLLSCLAALQLEAKGVSCVMNHHSNTDMLESLRQQQSISLWMQAGSTAHVPIIPHLSSLLLSGCVRHSVSNGDRSGTMKEGGLPVKLFFLPCKNCCLNLLGNRCSSALAALPGRVGLGGL